MSAPGPDIRENLKLRNNGYRRAPSSTFKNLVFHCYKLVLTNSPANKIKQTKATHDTIMTAIALLESASGTSRKLRI
jgi:hypothetical protein